MLSIHSFFFFSRFLMLNEQNERRKRQRARVTKKMSIKPQAHAIHMKKEIPITVVIVKGK